MWLQIVRKIELNKQSLNCYRLLWFVRLVSVWIAEFFFEQVYYCSEGNISNKLTLTINIKMQGVNKDSYLVLEKLPQE